jgi:hypothetical protein
VCGDPRHKLLTVGDFDADGKVRVWDLLEILYVWHQGGYYSMYDRDADADVDLRDVVEVIKELGKTSTALDRHLANAYSRFVHFQEVGNAFTDPTIVPEFQPFTASVFGHGVHWVNEAGGLPIIGLGHASFMQAEGLNIPENGDRVRGMFWGEAGVPVFEDGATDWPTPGGAWQDQRVIAFASHHTPSFTGDPTEAWHAHVGLCSVINQLGRFEVHQLTTYNECQAIFSAVPTSPDGVSNVWLNFWMLHVWLFDLNPRGPFAGAHPCVDQHSPTDEDTYGGREVPEWFHEHGGHGTTH